MTLKSQQPHNRRRRVGAAAVTAALSATALAASGSAAALAATDGSAGASAATASPVLQTLTYTATGPAAA